MDVDDLKRAFGRRVQALREAKGLTQEDLAARIERTVDTISNIERGANSTRIETACRLAQALGVALPELFEFGAGLDTEARARRRQINELVTQLAGLDDASFKLALEMLRNALALAGRSAPGP